MTGFKLPASVLAVALFGTTWGCGGGPSPDEAPAPAQPGPPPGARAPLVVRAARLRGTELRFTERGSGIPVVFVHGSLGSLETWRPQIDAFATRFRVIAYSRRYHPPNAARPDGQAYALDLHADDLIALIETLGLERVHLVGSSYGAYVALQVTLKRPDLVRSLVLVEPPILPWLARTPDGDSLRRAFEATVLDPARAAFARGDSVYAVRRFEEGVSVGARAASVLPLAAAFELRLELRADPAVYMPALSCPAVGRIRNSVLIVNGERSPHMFHLVTEELARCLTTEEIATIPGAGHAAYADNPASFNAAVFGFLMRN